jgi:hypothetical protein
MTDPYIGGDILDQAAEALRQGRTLESLASQLRCTPEHLARLLHLPSAKPIRGDKETGVDLWAFDRLEGQL